MGPLPGVAHRPGSPECPLGPTESPTGSPMHRLPAQLRRPVPVSELVEDPSRLPEVMIDSPTQGMRPVRPTSEAHHAQAIPPEAWLAREPSTAWSSAWAPPGRSRPSAASKVAGLKSMSRLQASRLSKGSTLGAARIRCHFFRKHRLISPMPDITTEHLRTGMEKMSSVFIQTASGLAVISSACLFVGWQWTKGYFGELGAPWAATLLSPQALIQNASAPLLGLLIGLVVMLMQLSAGTSLIAMQRWSVGLAFIAVSLLVAGFFGPPGILSHVRASQMLAWALIIMAFQAGIDIGEWIVRRGTLEKTTPIQRSMLYMALSFGLMWGPAEAGRAQGKLHGYEESPLPSLVTKDGTGAAWRLVAVLDGKLLAMQTHKDRDKRQFRLISVDDVVAITATHPIKQ